MWLEAGSVLHYAARSPVAAGLRHFWYNGGMAKTDFNLRDWLNSLPPLPETRTCPRCSMSTPNTGAFWHGAIPHCRGCMNEIALEVVYGIVPERRLHATPEGRIIGIDGTAL